MSKGLISAQLVWIWYRSALVFCGDIWMSNEGEDPEVGLPRSSHD